MACTWPKIVIKLTVLQFLEMQEVLMIKINDYFFQKNILVLNAWSMRKRLEDIIAAQKILIFPFVIIGN